MSGEGEYQNYSEINLNAIKNTKLFQKFMQNKSGLIPSSSSGTLSNPKKQHQQAQPQEAQVVRQKKWAKNRNANKVTKVLQAQQNRDEQQITNQKQDKIIIPPKNKSQPQIVPIQKPIENNETVRMRGLDKQQVPAIQLTRTQNQRNQMQASFGQRAQQNEVPMPQNNNPPLVPNRRKRNFNPNFETSRNQNQTVQQKNRVQLQVNNNDAYLSNEQQHKSVSYVSSFGIKAFSEPYAESSINIYNTATVRQQNFSYQDQPQPRAQYQAARHQYPHTYTYNQPQMPNPQPTTPPIPPTPLTESQYKQKYQSLLKKYQQLKQQLKAQNKNRKKQLTQWQHSIDMVKQKLFDVQSRQDTLLIQNQRLKQKWQSQNLLKMKTQQQNKQLSYKIKQLQDQLAMRQNHMKQKMDQTNYWKSQSEVMKQQLHGLRLNYEKRNDEYNLLLGDCQIVKRERDNKDYLLEDLRRNIAFLVEENSAAKDQIFKLVTKLYQLEQENQTLRNDIKRQSLDHSQLNNYMKDLQQQNRDRIQSTNIERQQYQRQFENRNDFQIMQKNQSFVLKQTLPRNSFPEQQQQQEKPVGGEKQTRRRGEFARERGQLARNQRVDRDQRPISQNMQNANIPQQRQQQVPQKNPQFANNNKVARMTEIAQQLQRIRDMKAMNGAIRRKKIQLERELQELEGQ